MHAFPVGLECFGLAVLARNVQIDGAVGRLYHVDFVFGIVGLEREVGDAQFLAVGGEILVLGFARQAVILLAECRFVDALAIVVVGFKFTLLGPCVEVLLYVALGKVGVKRSLWTDGGGVLAWACKVGQVVGVGRDEVGHRLLGDGIVAECADAHVHVIKLLLVAEASVAHGESLEIFQRCGVVGHHLLKFHRSRVEVGVALSAIFLGNLIVLLVDGLVVEVYAEIVVAKGYVTGHAEVVGAYLLKFAIGVERFLVLLHILMQLSLDVEQLLVERLHCESLVEECLQQFGVTAVDAALDAYEHHVVVVGVEHECVRHGRDGTVVFACIYAGLTEKHVDLLAWLVLAGRYVSVEVAYGAVVVLDIVGSRRSAVDYWRIDRCEGEILALECLHHVGVDIGLCKFCQSVVVACRWVVERSGFEVLVDVTQDALAAVHVGGVFGGELHCVDTHAVTVEGCGVDFGFGLILIFQPFQVLV